MYAGTYLFYDTKNPFLPKDLLKLVEAGVFPRENVTIADMSQMYPGAPEAWVAHVADATMYLTADAGCSLFSEMKQLHRDLVFTLRKPEKAPHLKDLINLLRKIGTAWTPHKFQKDTFRMRAHIYGDDMDGSGWSGESKKDKQYVIGIHFGKSIRMRWNVFKHGIPVTPECTSLTLKHGSMFVLDKAALCGEWKRYSIPTYRVSHGPSQYHAQLDRKMRTEWERQRKKRGIKGSWVEQVNKKQKTLRQCAAEDAENLTPPNTPRYDDSRISPIPRILSPNYWCLPPQEQVDISEPKDDYWKNMGDDLMEEWERCPSNVKDFALRQEEIGVFEKQVGDLLNEDLDALIDDYF